MAGINGNEKKLSNWTPALDFLLAKYGPMTAVIYGYIWRRSQGERKRCDSNRSTIKRFLHIDEKTFTTHARKLARDGYVRFQERGNSSTIYWPTGKAEIENANFSVEIFPTKRDSSREILPGSGEFLPDGVENIPGSGEILPTQQGNIPYDESIEDTVDESKKERKEEEGQTSASAFASLSEKEEAPAIKIWHEIVKPGRLTEKIKDEIIEGLGDNPDRDILQEAVKQWQEYARGKVTRTGKPYSLTQPDGILERYEGITAGPRDSGGDIIRTLKDADGNRVFEYTDGHTRRATPEENDRLDGQEGKDISAEDYNNGRKATQIVARAIRAGISAGFLEYIQIPKEIKEKIKNLMTVFVGISNLPVPDTNGCKEWFDELRSMLLDDELDQDDIRRSIKKMRDTGGIIKSPKSIRTVALDIKASNTPPH